MDALYRPRFGRTDDEHKCTDAAGDRLLDEPCSAEHFCNKVEPTPTTSGCRLWKGHSGECHTMVMRRVPCSLSYFCSQPNFHLGACDNLERLELVTVWDGETGEMMLCDDDVEQEPPFWVVPKARRARRTGT